jgi:hypothetical protein
MKWINIPINVPSLKNGKRIVRFGSKAKPIVRLIPSALHQEYEKNTAVIWKLRAAQFKEMTKGLQKPYYVAIYLIRTDRRRFDFTNATDTIQDLMVKNGWIEDDNVYEMIPVYAGHHVDKAKAGCYISVIEKPPIIERPPQAEDLLL